MQVSFVQFREDPTNSLLRGHSGSCSVPFHFRTGLLQLDYGRYASASHSAPSTNPECSYTTSTSYNFYCFTAMLQSLHCLSVATCNRFKLQLRAYAAKNATTNFSPSRGVMAFPWLSEQLSHGLSSTDQLYHIVKH